MNTKAEKLGHDTKFVINKFSDRSKNEINSMFTKVPPSNMSNVPVLDMGQPRVKRQLDHLPKMFNLVNLKIGGKYLLGPVKNQDSCSCCWAFAATALAEAAFSVHVKKRIILSDQEVCDCAARLGPGCSGGHPVHGLEYIKDTGLTLEAEYPYETNRSTVAGRCDAHEHDRELDPYTLTYYSIDRFNAEYQITRHLYNFKVPVAVAFRIGHSLVSYEGGVLELSDCPDVEDAHWHSGVIVGYGTKVMPNGRKVNFWIFKNSWDTNWGESGYVRIVRGDDWCAMESNGFGARIPD